MAMTPGAGNTKEVPKRLDLGDVMREQNSLYSRRIRKEH
jgi:hypothetical protein